MTQQALGAALGLTFQQVQKYERGLNRVSASKLWELSLILEATPGSFFDGLERGAGERVGPDPWQVLLAEPGVAQVARGFASIRSAAVRRRVLDLVQALSDGEGV